MEKLKRRKKPSPAPSRVLERYDLMKKLGGKIREGFKEHVEENAFSYKKRFHLGNPEAVETEEERIVDVSKMPAEEVYISARSGSTEFKMEWRDPDWYKSYIETAKQASNCYSFLDDNTKKWFRRVKPALDMLLELDKMSPEEFNKKHRKKIWELMKKKGAYMIYGKKGVFNFLLTFRRAVEVYPALEQTGKEGFDAKKLNIKCIKLSLGRGKGRKGGKEDRYAYVVIKRRKEDRRELAAPLPERPTLTAKQNRTLHNFLEQLEAPLYANPPHTVKELDEWLAFWHIDYVEKQREKIGASKKVGPVSRPESFENLKKQFQEFVDKNGVEKEDADSILAFLKAKSIKPHLGKFEYEVISSVTEGVKKEYDPEKVKQWWESMENWGRAIYKRDWTHYLPFILIKVFPEENKKSDFSSMTGPQIQTFLSQDPSRMKKIAEHFKK